MTDDRRDMTPPPALLPWPRHFEAGAGHLDLRRGLLIAPRAAAPQPPLVRRFQDRFDRLLGVAASTASPRLQVDAPVTGDWPRLDDDESFRLRIDAGGAVLEAVTPWGAAHGLERCLQWVESGAAGWVLPAVLIEDAPTLPWRGLMLDLARHFLDLPTLLRTLDGMAAAGLNVLHLHLNDDQGFRFESRRRPRLHERSGTDGYLSVQDVHTLVAAAGERGIRVVPELDVPGHAGAIVHACPELAAGTPPQSLPRAFGPSRHALDPSLDATWALLADLVDDLVEAFPDAWIHLGGDEVHPDAYAFDDRRRRDWMVAEGLADAGAIQAWFTRRMVALLAERGRRAVGWDEVLHPAMPERLAIQSWRGVATLEAALAAGHDALFSSGWYLDLCYPARLLHRFVPAAGVESLAHAERALAADPALADVAGGVRGLHEAAAATAARLPAGARRGRLLGGEACLWSELVTAELLDRRLHGPLAAVAERLWSSPEGVDVSDFEYRQQRWLEHLERVSDCRPLTLDPALPRRQGVRPEELDAVRTLLAALEPVRWYRRLLGPAVLESRLEGLGAGDAGARPFDADSPLCAPVDLLPPDSPGSATLRMALAALAADPADAGSRRTLEDLAGRWRPLPERLADLCRRVPAYGDLRARIDQLAALADILSGLVDALATGERPGDALRRRFSALAMRAGPAVAETELAPLAVLSEWLEPGQ